MLDEEEVAALTERHICRMSGGELARLIRTTMGAKLRPRVNRTLERYDIETLRHLVFLARRYCQNQLHTREDSDVNDDREWSGDWAA